MGVDVSVVVPVYNPGRYIDPCIDGALDQTLPSERYEFIFVDDGSTDDTPARLDQLAAHYEHVHVVHQPNSGWPGKPRNVGIERARGEFVFFCDHDDKLDREALERMVAMARRTGADVLLAKIVSFGRPMPHRIFRRNLDRAVLGQDPLQEALTPHKLFRREFLEAHDLRFPEGRRRLEDQVFVMAAYLLAGTISVLADHPCYYRMRRDDEGNAAFESWRAEYYYRFVAEVIDTIERYSEPGPVRDTLLARPYSGEMLGKIIGKRWHQKWDPTTRQEIFDEVRRLATERYPADFYRRMPIVRRAHGKALLADRPDAFADVAARAASVAPHARVRELRWDGDRLALDVEAELRYADGSPVLLTPQDDGWAIDPRLVPPELAEAPYSQSDVEFGFADVVARHHVKRVEWYLDGASRPELRPVETPEGAHRLVMIATAHLDPMTLAGGSRLAAGRWNVVARVSMLGVDGVARLAPVKPAAGTVRPALIGDPPLLARARFAGRSKKLRLDVTRGRRAVRAALRRRVLGADVSRGTLTLQLDLAAGAQPIGATVVLTAAKGRLVGRRAGLISAGPDGATLTSSLKGSPRLPGGRLRIAVAGARRGRPLRVGRLVVGRFGRVKSVSLAAQAKPAPKP